MKNSRQDYEELIAVRRQGCSNNYPGFESIRQTLEQECKSSNTCIAIYDIMDDTYHFLNRMFERSDKTQPVTLDRNAMNELVHPADRTYVLESKMLAIHKLNQVPANELADYKLIYECRMKDRQGNYHRVVHQYMVLATSTEGIPRLLRLQLDSMPGDTTQPLPAGTTLINVRTRRMLVSDSKTRLTKAEIEILRLLAKGYDSQKIASLRNNSIHTINNHRCSILRKTSMPDTGQAVLYARTIGAI